MGGNGNIPATVYFLTVTTVKGNSKNLAVGDNNQFSIIVIAVLGLICKTEQKEVEMKNEVRRK